ncbi:methyltransferase domain-containing protein [Patescibacteria group bacterium]
MNKFIDLIKETIKGKSFYRILFNWEVAKRCQNLGGICVDLASGKKDASYQRYWAINPQKLIRIDGDQSVEPDIVANLDEKIPLEDNSVDNVFLFNALCMIEKPEDLLGEVYRILKKEGKFFFNVQFIKAEESTVPDFRRYTSQKIEKILATVGFEEVEMFSVGERFSASGNLVDFVLCHLPKIFNFIKIPFRFLCLFLDKISPKKLKKNYPCPIAWFVIAKKS